jgi:stress response protein YsnF
MNRVLDAPAEIRIEDGVTIIPVMEERLKVEKQLILREEIRIVKKRTIQDPQTISLGNDRADVNSRPEPEG